MTGACFAKLAEWYGLPQQPSLADFATLIRKHWRFTVVEIDIHRAKLVNANTDMESVIIPAFMISDNKLTWQMMTPLDAEGVQRYLGHVFNTKRVDWVSFARKQDYRLITLTFSRYGGVRYYYTC